MPDKKKPYFSKSEREEILKQAMTFWDSSTEKMAEFFEVVNDCDRMYHGKLPLEIHHQFEAKPDRSAMVPPDININIRSLLADVLDFVFSTKPYGTVSLPGRPGQRGTVVDKAEAVLSADIDQSRFKKTAKKPGLQALVAGCSACKTEWHREYRRKIRRDEVGLPVLRDNSNFEYEYDLIAEYPRCIPIDIRRFRVDPKAEAISDAQIMGFHNKINQFDLIELNNNPDSPIMFDDEELKDSSFPHSKFYEYVAETLPIKDKEDAGDYGDKPVELIEIRGLFRLKKKYVDLIVKIANRKVLVEARPNNLPIDGVQVFDFPTVDSEYGRMFPMGLVERALDVFIEYFLKRNQSIDAANIQNYDMYLGDEGATDELPDKIDRISGRILKINLAATGSARISDVFGPIPKTANPIDTFQQAQTLKNDVQDSMIRNDYRQGLNPQRQETATAVAALEQAGIRDVKMLVENLTDSFFEPVWRKYLILRDFFKGHESYDVIADDGIEITIEPKDLRHPFNVTIDVSSALDRPAMIRRIVETLPMFYQMPETDNYALIKNAMWFFQYPNMDKILPPPEVKIVNIRRENLALKQGVWIPVHPNDDHALHIKTHREEAVNDALTPGDEFDLSQKGQSAYQLHIEKHMEFLEQAGAKPGFNTAVVNEGPNEGQLAGGSSPKVREVAP